LVEYITDVFVVNVQRIHHRIFKTRHFSEAVIELSHLHV